MKTATKWEREDLSYLKKYYSSVDYEELIDRLGRSKEAIKTKAHHLGLNRRNWSAEQIKFLKLNYKSMPMSELEEQLGKTSNAIKLKASRLKIRKNNIYR